MFQQHAASTSYDTAYIHLTLADAAPSVVPGQTTPASGRMLLALATMLLELGTLTPVSEWRLPTDTDELSTIKRCLSDGQLDTEPPCFRDAIDYCLECHTNNVNLTLPSRESLQGLVLAVVAPFQRDLRRSKMAAPP